MNIKRIISLAAAASLSMAMLASCGSNDESSTSEKKDNSSTAEAVVERIDGKGLLLRFLQTVQTVFHRAATAQWKKEQKLLKKLLTVK